MPRETKDVKVNLDLLKRYTTELDTLLKACSIIKERALAYDENSPREATEFIMEMSKAVGLASGIAQEASALTMDIMQEVRLIQSPGGDKYDALDKLLGLPSSTKSGGGKGGWGSGGFN